MSRSLPLTSSRSNVSVSEPSRSTRPALSTSLTTPRMTEPAGTSTRPSCIRSATVVVSKRCSTVAVSELNVVRSRTSTSCPAGIVPGAESFTVAGPLGACELT